MVKGPIRSIDDHLSWSIYNLRFAPDATTAFPHLTTLPSFQAHSEFLTKSISSDLLFAKWLMLSDASSAQPFLAGVAWIYNITDYDAEFGRLVVHSSCRGLGFAGELISHSISYSRDIGLNKLLLEVKDDNYPAISLYQSVGFRNVSDMRAGFIRLVLDL